MQLIPNDEFQRRQNPEGSSFVKVKKCAVTNRTIDQEGFIETRNTFGNEDVYVSVAAAKELGRMVGLVPQSEVTDVYLVTEGDDVPALTDQLNDMGDEIAFLHRQIDALSTLKELEQD